MSLEPTSYKVQLDGESYGTYWCLEKTCRNFYKFRGLNEPRRALQGREQQGREQQARSSKPGSNNKPRSNKFDVGIRHGSND